ncbi:MaoC like domain [Teratosphaeria destructans]|uniref:MaoC like domain n=1 Tax=Teratosphaeria destructans TaxID=418781 RepID=A0A9W7W6Q5_9PEZI|nr:MaoC like domain [Teratosphaeria destructans]
MPGEAAAGHEFPPVPVSWYKRDVLLFANSIGATVDELHFLYELHPNFAAFPTYPIILPFKKTAAEVIDFYAASASSNSSIPGAPKLDSKRANFEIRSKVVGIYDKGKAGTVVETQNDLVDADAGDVYCRALGSAFYVGQGNWGGPKGPKTVSYPPPEGKEPDVVYEHPIRAEAAHLYRLNGDYNPLHATPEPGKAMGFGGAIMHGLYSWNVTAHAILKLLGGSDPENLKEYAARFASPVLPGATLVTQIWRMGNADAEGFEDVRFVTSVKGGKVCLSNGRAKVKVVGQKKTPSSKL